MIMTTGFETKINNSELEDIDKQVNRCLEENKYYETLDREREYNLAKIIKKLPKDEKLKNPAGKELYYRNIRLAKSIAGEYTKKTPSHISYEEILTEAEYGLFIAIRGFDCDFIKEEDKKTGRTEGYRFSTFATWNIKGKINIYLRNRYQNISLDKDVYESKELMKFIGSKNDDYTELGKQEYIKDNISESIERLSKRNKKIIELRYGLIDGKTHTLEEVADQLNISRERVRQLENIALKELKRMKTIRMLS